MVEKGGGGAGAGGTSDTFLLKRGVTLNVNVYCSLAKYYEKKVGFQRPETF